jgi:hypothetical protein
MVQETIIKSNSAFHPTFDSFNASISVAGSPSYAQLTLPQTQGGDHVPVTIDQDVAITNVDAFTAYNVALLGSESLDMALVGNTYLHEGAFPAAQVTYNKVVTMKGFNALKGFSMLNFSVSLVPGPDGSNMHGFLSIPNPSVITVEMGNVTFNNFVDGDLIGNSTIQNFVLAPGSNTVAMTSIVDQGKVLTLIATKYTSGVIPIDVIGKSSVYNGQHLPYFEAALKASKQTLNLDVGAAVKAAMSSLPQSG